MNAIKHKQSHTPTVVKGRGEWNPGFLICCNISKDFTFCRKPLVFLQDEVYIMGSRAAGGPVTSYKMAAILTTILVLLEIRDYEKTAEIGNI